MPRHVRTEALQQRMHKRGVPVVLTACTYVHQAFALATRPDDTVQCGSPEAGVHTALYVAALAATNDRVPSNNVRTSLQRGMVHFPVGSMKTSDR